jgi:hypothetical protein
MTPHADSIRQILAQAPAGARQLIEKTGFSQPTLSRALTGMDGEVLRWGAARSIQYALRDARRAALLGLADIPVYQVDASGRVKALGLLSPVRPEGFLMRRDDEGAKGAASGSAQHSDGLPWWLVDMRPQGYLGRAYVARHAAALGLPARLTDWSDTHVLRGLLANKETSGGQDAVGNLLLGDAARDDFLHAPAPVPIPAATEPEAGAAYARLAMDAASGDLPGSSAGGEQPKFTAYVETQDGPRHVLVKFTQADADAASNPVTQRWRDLLLAEHHALQTLKALDVDAANSRIIDTDAQRFLEVTRFDRIGATGRRSLFSLASLEAEFVGDASSPWPVLTAKLAQAGVITHEAAQTATLLHAFGMLIGNTDMHHGNLSFTGDDGPPCALAPAYDMLPMGYAPSASGHLPGHLPAARLHASVAPDVWRKALEMARNYLHRLQAEPRFSKAFSVCLADLSRHVDDAEEKIGRLG